MLPEWHSDRLPPIRSFYRNDSDYVVQTIEIIRIGGVEGQLRSGCDRCDHEISCAPSRSPAAGSDCGADTPERPSGLCLERNRIELIFGAL